MCFFWLLLGRDCTSFSTELSTAPSRYSWVRLELLGAPNLYYPGALSEDGLVGGYYRRSSTQAPFDLPVIWDATGRPFPLPVSGPYEAAVVNGFGPAGKPVGVLARGAPEPGIPGYWAPDGFVALPHTGSGGGAMTGNGEVVIGQTRAVPGGKRQPILWNDAVVRVVQGLEETDNVAQSISTHGVYVGVSIDTSNPSDYEYGAFIGRDGMAVRLNFPSFPETRAYEINDDGWFTGVWEPAFATQRGYVARYDLDTGESEIHDLGLFPGYGETIAAAINNDRTIVGGAQHLGGDFDRALIWWQGSLTPQDLNLFVDLPEATLIDAYRINNAGQILAEGRLNDGSGYAYYVLTPVPEPGAVGLAAAGVIALRRTRPTQTLRL